MFVRQMHYLVALAREKHFGRAAEACHVTQPTLSAGIRKLEQELGVPIVVRGHRFLGFTAEGERVLGWARQIAADYESLKQERVETGGRLTGTLRIGAIPAATAAAPALLAPFRDRHPEVKVQMLTLSSVAIQRGLDEMELDAGITYLENEPLNRVRRLDLYLERYVFVTRPDEPLARRRTVRWAEAAAQPLCLLTPTCRTGASSTMSWRRPASPRSRRSRPIPSWAYGASCAAARGTASCRRRASAASATPPTSSPSRWSSRCTCSRSGWCCPSATR